MEGTQGPSGLTDMAQRNLKLLETGQYHDFVINCGDRAFKVHRNIVCPQSTMLTTLCDPAWREGSEGSASLEEQDPAIVEKALRFLYAGTYDGECGCGMDTSKGYIKRSLKLEAALAFGQDLLTHVQVYVLADYLSVEGLKLQALARCTHQMTDHFNPLTMIGPISVALANTKSDDSGLRRQILRSCTAHSAQVKISPELERLLQDHEPMAWPLLLEAHAQSHALEARIDVAQLDAARLRSLLEVRTGDLQRAHENLRLVANVMKSTTKCRNELCDKDFGASLETYANGYIKGLRCKRCNCRHSINGSAS